jgi:hypothetical protein
MSDSCAAQSPEWTVFLINLSGFGSNERFFEPAGRRTDRSIPRDRDVEKRQVMDEREREVSVAM